MDSFSAALLAAGYVKRGGDGGETLCADDYEVSDYKARERMDEMMV
jgi:hypothetical protein